MLQGAFHAKTRPGRGVEGGELDADFTLLGPYFFPTLAVRIEF